MSLPDDFSKIKNSKKINKAGPNNRSKKLKGVFSSQTLKQDKIKKIFPIFLIILIVISIVIFLSKNFTFQISKKSDSLKEETTKTLQSEAKKTDEKEFTNEDFRLAYEEQNRVMKDFLDYYDEYGGLGKEKSITLITKFDTANSTIERQINQFSATNTELGKAYQKLLKTDEMFLLEIKAYVDFMKVLGPIFEEIYLIKQELTVNNLSEIGSKLSYVEEKQKQLGSWYAAIQAIDTAENNIIMQAKNTYLSALNGFSRYLEETRYAIKGNSSSYYNQANQSFENIYWEESKKMLEFLQIYANQDINDLLDTAIEAGSNFLNLLGDESLIESSRINELDANKTGKSDIDQSSKQSDSQDNGAYLPQGWQLCTNKDNDFQIAHPADWWCGNLEYDADKGLVLSPQKQISLMATDLSIVVSKNNQFWIEMYEQKAQSSTDPIGKANLPNYSFEVVSGKIEVGPIALYRSEINGDIYIIVGFYPGTFDSSKYDPLIYEVVQTFKLL
ncbi:MAG: hypothetical protein PVJ09_01940 [Candidatus Woesebacteria bacterium]|jgi:hypothetical protein